MLYTNDITRVIMDTNVLVQMPSPLASAIRCNLLRLLSFCTMAANAAPQRRRAGRRDVCAEEVAAASDSVKSVSFRDNFLSGHQRPWKTKDGSWTVHNLDKLDYHDFSKTLSALSDEMRAKPHNGISEAAATFKEGTEALREFQRKGLVGTGVNSLLSTFETQQPCFEVLDSFGGADVSRNKDDIEAAARSFVSLFAKLGSNGTAQNLVCDLRRCAVRMAHMAQWLQSSMSMAAEPSTFAKSVPRPEQQHGGHELAAVKQQGTQESLVRFLTSALSEKNGKRGRGAPSAANVGTQSYEDVDLLAADLPFPAPLVAVPPPPTGTAAVGFDMANMQMMMKGMLQQMMTQQGAAVAPPEPARSSSAVLNLAEERKAAALWDEGNLVVCKKTADEEVEPRSKKARKQKADEEDVAEAPKPKKQKKADEEDVVEVPKQKKQKK